jgi:hypothetical protein
METSSFVGAMSTAVGDVVFFADVAPRVVVSGPPPPPLPSGQQHEVTASFSFPPDSVDEVSASVSALQIAIASQVSGLSPADVSVFVNPSTGSVQVSIASSGSVRLSTITAAMDTSSFVAAMGAVVENAGDIVFSTDVPPRVVVSGPPPPPLPTGQQHMVSASFSFPPSAAGDVSSSVEALQIAVASQVPGLSAADVSVFVNPSTGSE